MDNMTTNHGRSSVFSMNALYEKINALVPISPYHPDKVKLNEEDTKIFMKLAFPRSKSKERQSSLKDNKSKATDKLQLSSYQPIFKKDQSKDAFQPILIREKSKDAFQPILIREKSKDFFQPILKREKSKDAFQPILKREKSKDAFQPILKREKSKDVFLVSIDDIQPPKYKKVPRKLWDSNFQFKYACMTMIVCSQTFSDFPMNVYKNGCLTFILCYICVLLLLAFPLIFIEISLGQFLSQSACKAFKMTPLLTGLGWTIYLSAAMQMFCKSANLTWSSYYFFQAVFNMDDFPYCYNRTYCTPYRIENTSEIYSTSEFWNVFVSGIYTDTNTLINPTKSHYFPNISVVISHIFIWTCLVIIFIFVNFFMKNIIYFTGTMPYFVLYFMVLITSALPGCLNGIKYYLTFDLKYLNTETFEVAIRQVFYSLSLSGGAFLTLSSINKFHSNLYKDAILFVIIEGVSSCLCGLVFFSLIGYIEKLYNLEKLIINDSYGIMFIIYPCAFAESSLHQFWICLFLFSMLSMQINALVVFFKMTKINIEDHFGLDLGNLSRKSLIVIIIFTGCFALITSIFTMPFGQYFLHLYRTKYELVLQVSLYLIEIFLIIFCYKRSSYERDICLMYENRYLHIILDYVFIFCPLFLIATLCIYGYNYSADVAFLEQSIPVYFDVISMILISLIILPIFLHIGVHLFLDMEKGKSFGRSIQDGLKTPIDHGPLDRRNWLISKHYLRKLVVISSVEKEYSTLRSTNV